MSKGPVEPADPTDPTDPLVELQDEVAHVTYPEEDFGDEPVAAAPDNTEAAEKKKQPRLGSWHDMARSGGVKFVALGVSAVLGIIITRVIITNYGTEVFAQYGLLVGLGALIQVNALGVGAPLVNTVAVSDDPGHDEHLRRVILSSLRVLTLAALVLIAVVGLMTAMGWWGPLLGDSLLPGSGPIAAALCMLLWALGMPVGIGQRLLAGLGKNHLTIAISGLQSPLVLLVLALSLLVGADSGAFIAVVSYAATLIIALICLVIAARMIRPTLTTAIRQIPWRRKFRGAKILDQAGPMTVIMIALPIAMQTDRIVLSHVAEPSQLAQYNLASQMYNPIFALVSAAGFTLWPRFAAARAKNKDESPLQLSLVFGAIGAILAIGVSVISPLLAQFASGGEIQLGLLLISGFSVLMIIQALQYPMGMYLTDKKGLRFQAFMVTLLLPVNLALSWILASSLGAAGPVIGSLISIFCFQVLANVIYIRFRTKPSGDEPAPMEVIDA